MSVYGYFDDRAGEYVIKRVNTPRPWINYLVNDRYVSTISGNGGGISYTDDPLHGRITRYRINAVPYDRPGKYLYLRDRESGKYWSLTWQPVGKRVNAYQAVHGLGYSRMLANRNGIHSSVLFFVPRKEPLEIWRVRLQNRSLRKRSLDLYGYVEFCLGHALIDLINQCDDQHFNRVKFDPDWNGLLATKTYWVSRTLGTQQQENQAWDHWAFFICSGPIRGYETRREHFIGAYRDESRPLALEQEKLAGMDTDFGNAVGALQTGVELKPGESIEVIFNLGVVRKTGSETPRKPRSRIFLESPLCDRALKQVNRKWERFLKSVQVDTPDERLNRFMNIWTPYQARTAFDTGRLSSFYYWGIGRGLGFRDTAQDTLAVTIGDPEKALERIMLLARQIFRDGRVYHHFYPKGGGEQTGHCDDPLWFILPVTDYVRETGDLGLLNREADFAGGGRGTLLDHLLAVADFAESRLGPHSLPVFGRGDWNDTLDYIGGEDGGESVWGGMFYIAMLQRFIELARAAGKEKIVTGLEALHDRIRRGVTSTAWDGEWFIRALGGGGRSVGSRKNRCGKIFLNSQTWAVIAGITERALLIRAMDSVREFLDTEYGPKICAPAYQRIDPAVGLVTRCVAGKKENAAVFLHTTAWLIQAECLLGRGNQAYHYYTKLLPDSLDSDLYMAEPYVYSQYVTSDEHPTAGMASHSWQTGTAAWMYRVVGDYMLGVRSDYGGLIVDPVIPSHWTGFRIQRQFRGSVYQIRVSNPEGVERGVREIRVEGKTIEGNRLPVSEAKTCRVEVILGR
jgi:cellobiose phosphorylase